MFYDYHKRAHATIENKQISGDSIYHHRTTQPQIWLCPSPYTTSIDTLINKIDSIFIPKSNHIKYPFKLLLISLLLNNSFKCTSSKSHAVVDRDSCIIFKIRLRITFFFVKLRQTIVGLSNLMQSLNSQPENARAQ
jgi:hypothetical protein